MNFDHNADWWQTLSQLYREQKNWQCEICKLSLHQDKRYLHTHHIWGTKFNKSEDLMALCIGCHSEQPGEGHLRLKETREYQDFIAKYKGKWGIPDISNGEATMNYIIPPREEINDDNELYRQYWSEFHAYYTFKGIPPTPLGIREENPKNYYFKMESFNPFHIDFSISLLNSSEISANLNLNKQIDKTQKIFEALKSGQEYFQRFFEELLFLDDRSRAFFIIGCKKEADIREPKEWLNQFEWLCTNLEELNKVFLPALRVTQHYEETLL